MSKSRISSTQRKASRFIGLALGGGKADKAGLVVLEHYPDQNKIFLAKLFEKIKTEENISADLKIHEIISQFNDDQLQSITFDVPLTLPKCLRCRLACPGFEVCKESEIRYIRSLYHEHTDKKKPKKMYTPYTQRCADAYLASIDAEKLDAQHAMGANLAPLTARAFFIRRRLKAKFNAKLLEAFPKLSVMLIGKELKLTRTQLLNYRNSIQGSEVRKIFIEAMIDKWGLFIYEQDRKELIEDYHSFDALICAFSGFLKSKGKVQKIPKNFPPNEGWVEIPKFE